MIPGRCPVLGRPLGEFFMGFSDETKCGKGWVLEVDMEDSSNANGFDLEDWLTFLRICT